MIQQSVFEEALKEYERQVGRAECFFALASDLMRSGDSCRLAAYLLLLATWNSPRFRFVWQGFDINSFARQLQKLEPVFASLDHLTLAAANLDDYKRQITFIYEALSKIKGVEYTGASKLMQLRNPALFVMWDGYIRGEKSNKFYKELSIVKSHEWERRLFTTSADSYIEFLKDMQARFHHLAVPESLQGKSLAKAIDEFNYVNITFPIQLREKTERKSKVKFQT